MAVTSAQHQKAHQKKANSGAVIGILALAAIGLGVGAYELLHGGSPSGSCAGGIAPGSLVTADGGNTYYVIGPNCTAHPVSAAAITACCYATQAAITITPAQLAALTIGSAVTPPSCPPAPTLSGCTPSGGGCSLPNGSLVQPSGGSGIYVIDNGTAYPIASKAIFDQCGYEASAVQTVSASALASCPTGASVTPGNCPSAPQGQGYPGPNCPMGPGLLAITPQGSVWYCDCGTGPGGQGCQKHAVTGEVFYGCGWQHQRLYPVADAILNATPTGAPLTGCVPLYTCS